MGTKLKEGQVVQSSFFVRGNMGRDQIIKVGDYEDNYIYLKYYNHEQYANGEPSIDENRSEKEYLVLSVEEQFPQTTVGHRTSSYQNTIVAIELNADGTYNEENQKISFSTCYVYTGAIMEENIHIVREMKKTYI
ncbi:hypothetical protein CVD28_02030 [Bacillus sp. M6-12]|uniref:hypothetical protein n=1 Tax=Bacillus sp. M6-12 TaxID=2054166 RepID=UPI000C774378|nr:hypothetical protein [Bacillus sp. M6-12]PLS19211.1 hypothetical protein CVD28_02030 [Bacillus sp. M6-12]